MLLIIGLDGATWDLMDPWIAAGRLPNVARLRARGVSGPLASTVPPVTMPSWTTFMTGVNPARHGIFDFTRREPGTYEVRFVNGTFRKAPTIWRMLSDAGRRVCVLGLPGTYPPEPLNGYMVSGFDTPVTTRADRSFVYPPELAAVVTRAGGFPFADFQEFRIGRGWHQTALDRLSRGIEVKSALARTLLQSEPWDCLLVLFGESDTVAHHFWQFHDSSSPRYDAAGAARFGDAILRVYEALDDAIGKLTETVPEADVLIVSDHGFGGAGDKAVYLNQWLCAAGFQRAERRGGSRSVAAVAKRVALNALPPAVQARAFRWRGARWASRLESRARFGGIQWGETRAFSEELNYFPSVWLNVKGREPEGAIAPEDYERVRDDVCAAALTLSDPEHGRPIVRRAWRREELYDGPWMHYGPDIVLEFHLDRGYSYCCLPSTGPSSPVTRHLSPAECRGGKLAGMGGSHRPNGVFVLTGPDLPKAQWVDRVHIADMAPTILSACGLDFPKKVDGSTVQSIVNPRQGPAAVGARVEDGERVYSDPEEAEIAARLTNLGYLQ